MNNSDISPRPLEDSELDCVQGAGKYSTRTMRKALKAAKPDEGIKSLKSGKISASSGNGSI